MEHERREVVHPLSKKDAFEVYTGATRHSKVIFLLCFSPFHLSSSYIEREREYIYIYMFVTIETKKYLYIIYPAIVFFFCEKLDRVYAFFRGEKQITY